MKKLSLIGLCILLVAGCNNDIDVSDPWQRFCYNLNLDDFTYSCEWENLTKVYNYPHPQIRVKCQFSSVQYKGQEYCGIENTKLGYSIFDDDYFSDYERDGIRLPCHAAGESLNKALDSCYELIPEELNIVTKEINERGG